MSEVNEKVSIAWNPIICYPRFTAWLHVLTDNTVPPHASIVFYSSNCMCQPDKTNALFFPRAFPLTQVIRGIFFNLTHYQLHHEFSLLEYRPFMRTYIRTLIDVGSWLFTNRARTNIDTKFHLHTHFLFESREFHETRIYSSVRISF